MPEAYVYHRIILIFILGKQSMRMLNEFESLRIGIIVSFSNAVVQQTDLEYFDWLIYYQFLMQDFAPHTCTDIGREAVNRRSVRRVYVCTATIWLLL
jgi:hypothetical protein